MVSDCSDEEECDVLIVVTPCMWKKMKRLCLCLDYVRKKIELMSGVDNRRTDGTRRSISE